MATRKALHDSSPERGAARTINKFRERLKLYVKSKPSKGSAPLL
jgi:hypothetical protein